MSVQPSTTGLTTDKSSICSEPGDYTASTARQDEPDARGRPLYTKEDVASHSNNRYLRTPQSQPSRPLSPDALSLLSADEFEQLHPSRPVPWPRHGGLPPGQPPQKLIGWRDTLSAYWIRNKGLAYMLLAQVFGVLMNVTTRLLEVEGNKGEGLHPFQILFARMGITVVLASAWMWYKKTPHFPLGKPEVRGLLAARGFGGFFGVFGMYYSLQYLPLADCTVLTFLAPGLVCWVCSILINEPFTRIEKIATVISFLGVILIARPTSFFPGSGETPPASGDGDMVPPSRNGTAPIKAPSDASDYDNVTPEQRLEAVAIALLGVCGTVVAFTTIRWIGQRAHPLISVNYFAVWCTIVSFVMQLILPGLGFLLPADLKEWGYLIFLGICGFVMQFLLAAGLSYEKSSRATNMTYTQMLFALTFDKFFFGHSPNWMSIVGSSLILGPAIFVAMQKNADASKDSNDVVASGRDEEAQRGLMGDFEEDDGPEAGDGEPTQEGR